MKEGLQRPASSNCLSIHMRYRLCDSYFQRTNGELHSFLLAKALSGEWVQREPFGKLVISQFRLLGLQHGCSSFPSGSTRFGTLALHPLARAKMNSKKAWEEVMGSNLYHLRQVLNRCFG